MTYPILNGREIRHLMNHYNKNSGWGSDRDDVQEILKSISRMIRNFHQSGMDISLKSLSYANDHAFKLIEGGTVSSCGVIRLFDVEHLFAIITKKEEQECLDLYLSMHDVRFSLHKNKIRSTHYDLKEDPENFTRFQQRIILNYAALKQYRDCDVSGMLEKNNQPRSLKPVKTTFPKSAPTP